METRYFKKKIAVTTAEASYDLPVLTIFSVLNAGDADVTLEIDNDIDADSLVLSAGGSVDFSCNAKRIRHKTSTGTATLYLSGTRQIKA